MNSFRIETKEEFFKILDCDEDTFTMRDLPYKQLKELSSKLTAELKRAESK